MTHRTQPALGASTVPTVTPQPDAWADFDSAFGPITALSAAAPSKTAGLSEHKVELIDPPNESWAVWEDEQPKTDAASSSQPPRIVNSQPEASPPLLRKESPTQQRERIFDNHMWSTSSVNPAYTHANSDTFCDLHAISEFYLTGNITAGHNLIEGDSTYRRMCESFQKPISPSEILAQSHIINLKSHTLEDGVLNPKDPMLTQLRKNITALTSSINNGDNVANPYRAGEVLFFVNGDTTYAYAIMVEWNQKKQAYQYLVYDSHGGAHAQYPGPYTLRFTGSNAIEELSEYLVLLPGVTDNCKIYPVPLHHTPKQPVVATVVGLAQRTLMPSSAATSSHSVATAPAPRAELKDKDKAVQPVAQPVVQPVVQLILQTRVAPPKSIPASFNQYTVPWSPSSTMRTNWQKIPGSPDGTEWKNEAPRYTCTVMATNTLDALLHHRLNSTADYDEILRKSQNQAAEILVHRASNPLPSSYESRINRTTFVDQNDPLLRTLIPGVTVSRADNPNIPDVDKITVNENTHIYYTQVIQCHEKALREGYFGPVNDVGILFVVDGSTFCVTITLQADKTTLYSFADSHGEHKFTSGKITTVEPARVQFFNSIDDCVNAIERKPGYRRSALTEQERNFGLLLLFHSVVASDAASQPKEQKPIRSLAAAAAASSAAPVSAPKVAAQPVVQQPVVQPVAVAAASSASPAIAANKGYQVDASRIIGAHHNQFTIPWEGAYREQIQEAWNRVPIIVGAQSWQAEAPRYFCTVAALTMIRDMLKDVTMTPEHLDETLRTSQNQAAYILARHTADKFSYDGNAVNRTTHIAHNDPILLREFLTELKVPSEADWRQLPGYDDRNTLTTDNFYTDVLTSYEKALQKGTFKGNRVGVLFIPDGSSYAVTITLKENGSFQYQWGDSHGTIDVNIHMTEPTQTCPACTREECVAQLQKFYNRTCQPNEDTGQDLALPIDVYTVELK